MDKKVFIISLSVLLLLVLIMLQFLPRKTYKDNELFCYQIFLKGEGYTSENNMRYGYKDASGKIILPAIYEDCCGWEGFHNGIKPVKCKGLWKYIDTSGKTVLKIKKQYQYLYNFSEDLAPFTVDNGPGKTYTEGFIDRAGKEVIPPVYLSVYGFREGLSAVCVNNDKQGRYGFGGLWGYIDKTGKMVISPRFSDANSFKNGKAAVCLGKCPPKTDNYYIDHTGNTISLFFYPTAVIQNNN